METCGSLPSSIVFSLHLFFFFSSSHNQTKNSKGPSKCVCVLLLLRPSEKTERNGEKKAKASAFAPHPRRSREKLTNRPRERAENSRHEWGSIHTHTHAQKTTSSRPTDRRWQLFCGRGEEGQHYIRLVLRETICCASETKQNNSEQSSGCLAMDVSEA